MQVVCPTKYDGMFLPKNKIIIAKHPNELPGVSDNVILFGSCGLLYHFVDPRELLVPRLVGGIETSFELRAQLCQHSPVRIVPESVTSAFSVHETSHANYVRGRYPNALFTDMESGLFASYFRDAGCRFAVVRYGIDYCDRKLMVTGINWCYRWMHHYTMQRKFWRIYNEISKHKS